MFDDVTGRRARADVTSDRKHTNQPRDKLWTLRTDPKNDSHGMPGRHTGAMALSKPGGGKGEGSKPKPKSGIRFRPEQGQGRSDGKAGGGWPCRPAAIGFLDQTARDSAGVGAELLHEHGGPELVRCEPDMGAADLRLLDLRGMGWDGIGSDRIGIPGAGGRHGTCELGRVCTDQGHKEGHKAGHNDIMP